jgi:hypothetical protein
MGEDVVAMVIFKNEMCSRTVLKSEMVVRHSFHACLLQTSRWSGQSGSISEAINKQTPYIQFPIGIETHKP